MRKKKKLTSIKNAFALKSYVSVSYNSRLLEKILHCRCSTKPAVDSVTRDIKMI